jgi:hypothetical protein
MTRTPRMEKMISFFRDFLPLPAIVVNAPRN